MLSDSRTGRCGGASSWRLDLGLRPPVSVPCAAPLRGLLVCCLHPAAVQHRYGAGQQLQPFRPIPCTSVCQYLYLHSGWTLHDGISDGYTQILHCKNIFLVHSANQRWTPGNFPYAHPLVWKFVGIRLYLYISISIHRVLLVLLPWLYKKKFFCLVGTRYHHPGFLNLKLLVNSLFLDCNSKSEIFLGL